MINNLLNDPNYTAEQKVQLIESYEVELWKLNY